MTSNADQTLALQAFLDRPTEADAVPLSWASAKRGWLVVMQGEDQFDVWTPADRPAAVPCALPPCTRTLSRSDLITFLQSNWL